MEILSVATELAPFVKVGGLADVTAALSKALRGLGHQVTLILPRFPGFEEGGLLVARRLTPVKFSLGDRACLALAKELDLPTVTADSAWAKTPVGVEVRLVR